MITLGAILLTVSLSVGPGAPGNLTTPATAFQAVEREAHLLCAGLTRFVNNLRLVYDLRALAEPDAPNTRSGSRAPAAGKTLLDIDLNTTAKPSPLTRRNPASTP